MLLNMVVLIVVAAVIATIRAKMTRRGLVVALCENGAHMAEIWLAKPPFHLLVHHRPPDPSFYFLFFLELEPNRLAGGFRLINFTMAP